MIKIMGSELWRAGEKVGWIEGDHIRAHDGEKLGYFQGTYIYNPEGQKIAYIEGDYLCSEGTMNDARIPLTTVNESIQGGVLSEVGKCAVYVLLGG